VVLTRFSNISQDDQDRYLHTLPNAEDAVFNSSKRQHDDLCLKNTRVAILNEIRAWTRGQDDRNIFWLNGLAGTGKSTIARTIAREYYEQKCLAASFFFSRGGGDVSHAGKFFTSLARQLAEQSPSLKKYICEAIAADRNIANEALRDQWHSLILNPLQRLDRSQARHRLRNLILRPLSKRHHNFPPFLIIVVDALDECADQDNVQIIIQLFAEVRSLTNVKIRVFMTSRPEVHTRYGFLRVSSSQAFVLHDIPSQIVDRDITLFFEHQFKIIRQERGLPTDWPGPQNRTLLVQKAAGLFIWAATAYRFVCEGKYADKRLALLLGGSDSPQNPERQLDQIYLTVLKSSIGQDSEEQERSELCEALKTILGTIVILYSPLSLFSLAGLLRMPTHEASQTLHDLHSILDVPKDQFRPIRLHHPSFRDFLLNKNRCNDPRFLVDEKKAHQALADFCIKLMSEGLKEDICDLHSPGALAKEVTPEAVRQRLPMELQYACLYWVQHVQKSETRLEDNGQAHIFLQKHFLHWLEATSLMGKTSEAVLALISLDSMVPVSLT